MSGEISRAVADGHWCILRTSGGRTLPLARSLVDADFEVWTPVETISRRRPRSKIKIDIEAPIMPTFVFARAWHLPELLACASSPINEHPSFSVFHYAGKIPLVAEREVEGLRREEHRAMRRVQRTQRKDFAIGERVRVPEGPFAGMSGVVQQSDGKFALVGFAGTMRVKIATFLLDADALQIAHPTSGTAARAA
jgi:transcription antitermination factor NusG